METSAGEARRRAGPPSRASISSGVRDASRAAHALVDELEELRDKLAAIVLDKRTLLDGGPRDAAIAEAAGVVAGYVQQLDEALSREVRRALATGDGFRLDAEDPANVIVESSPHAAVLVLARGVLTLASDQRSRSHVLSGIAEVGSLDRVRAAVDGRTGGPSRRRADRPQDGGRTARGRRKPRPAAWDRMSDAEKSAHVLKVLIDRGHDAPERVIAEAVGVHRSRPGRWPWLEELRMQARGAGAPSYTLERVAHAHADVVHELDKFSPLKRKQQATCQSRGCGDVFEPYLCELCGGMLVADRCRECHDELEHDGEGDR